MPGRAGALKGAARAGEAAGVTVIDGECILMFAEPAGWFHRLHRGLYRLGGKLPK